MAESSLECMLYGGWQFHDVDNEGEKGLVTRAQFILSNLLIRKPFLPGGVQVRPEVLL